jgi:ParB family chromosome partitioning protein
MSKSNPTTPKRTEIVDVPLDLLDDPQFDARTWASEEGIFELADSIKARGVLVPLRVFKKGKRYEVQAGSRRLAAAKLAKLQTIPCMVIKTTKVDNEIDKLTENLCREDLSALDKSRVLHTLHTEHNFTPADLSKMLGVNQSRIWQLMGIANFHPLLLNALDDKRIGEHIARELNKIKSEKKLRYLLEYCVDGGATINTVKGWVQQWLSEQNMPEPPQDDYTGPPQGEPYVPGRAKCKGCVSWFNPNALINVTLCADCFLLLQDFFKRMKQLEAEEEENVSDAIKPETS